MTLLLAAAMYVGINSQPPNGVISRREFVPARSKKRPETVLTSHRVTIFAGAVSRENRQWPVPSILSSVWTVWAPCSALLLGYSRILRAAAAQEWDRNRTFAVSVLAARFPHVSAGGDTGLSRAIAASFIACQWPSSTPSFAAADSDSALWCQPGGQQLRLVAAAGARGDTPVPIGCGLYPPPPVAAGVRAGCWTICPDASNGDSV